MNISIEACVDTVESALAAEAGGADRVELCDNLVEGGTTPSAGTIAVCRRQVRIPVFVLIRPRGGDFLYTEEDVRVMLHDLAIVRELGAHGVVLGALNRDGTIAVEMVRMLVESARPLQTTFHRAFDLCRNPDEGLETLIGLGIGRVLTSGQAQTAFEGRGAIGRLVRQAGDRISILAGGGITEDNVATIVKETGVREVHVRGTSRIGTGMECRGAVTIGKAFEPNDYERTATDPGRIRKIRQTIG